MQLDVHGGFCNAKAGFFPVRAQLRLHSQKKQGDHDEDHTHCRKARAAQLLDKKEGRHSDEDRRPEADELPFGQIEKYFCFDPRKIPRDGDVCCQLCHLLSVRSSRIWPESRS